MSKNPPIKPAKNKLSVEVQNKNIVNDALASLSVLNEGQRGTRIVTNGMAKTIVKRSLERTEGETYSLRRQRALAEVSQFANAIKKDRPLTASASNADLLPIAHPQSARPHRLDSKDVYRLQARWYSDDPRVTDPLVASLLASAFTAHPNSPEYEYSVARLSAMGASQVTLEALVAAFKPGANNFYWMRQLRGLNGRFIKMGGAIRRFVRRLGKVFSLAGRMVSADPNSKKVTVELPNGRLVRYPAAEGNAALALIPSEQSPDGFSKEPVRVSAGDPVIDEADLEFVDFPDGWGVDTSWEPSQDDKDYYGENLDLGKMFVSANDNYEVIKFDKANFPARNRFEMAQQKEAEENDVIAYGKGEDDELDPELPVYFVRRKDDNDKDFAAVQSWADVQNLVKADEELYEEGRASNPRRPANVDELGTPENPAGKIVDYKKLPGDVVPGNPDASSRQVAGYEKKLEKFNEEGGEFPLDPRRSYFLMDDGTIVDTETGEVLRDSQGNTEPAETEGAPEPVAQLPEPEADELLEGFDYEKAKNDPDYVDAFLDAFDAGVYAKPKQDTAGMSDSQKEGIDAGYALGDKKYDEALELARGRFPRFDAPNDRDFERAGEELIDARLDVAGPIYDELERLQAEAKGPEAEAPEAEAPEAPEAEKGSTTVPEGYYDVDRGDYFPEGAVNGQTSDDFTDDPAQLAQEYSAEDLRAALEQAVKGDRENPATGFGQLSFDDGLEVVPAEALYKALDEKGLFQDADEILDEIYAEGRGDSAPDLSPEPEEPLDEATPDPEQEEDFEQEIPPLIDGLTEDEKNEFLETGDYKKYLPKNKVYGDSDVPEGYAGIDDEPWTEIEGDLPEDAPDGFSLNPVEIANDYNNEDLIEQLRQALEPGNTTPGYGILGMDTPEGEEFVANVPVEAIRDALQLQGVDTDELIDAIFEEGFRGQGSDEPDASEIQDAIDGENIEEIEDGREPGEPGEPGADGDARGPRPSSEVVPEGQRSLGRRRSGATEGPWSSLGDPLPEAPRAQEFRDDNRATPELFELDAQNDAEAFKNAMLKLKENNKFAASVYIYEVEEYQNMRLFATADGTAGIALKPNGDIVSAFVHGDSPHRGAIYSMISQMVELGGDRLDAYDTVLPEIYAKVGFRPVARARWVDGAADPAWDKETYKKFNNGEPDVVAMVYDPTRVGSTYDPKEGEYYNDYDAAIAARDLELESPEAPRTETKRASSLAPGDEVKMPDGTFMTVKKNFSVDDGFIVTFDDGSRRGTNRKFDQEDVVEVKAPEAALETPEREDVEERQEPTAQPEEKEATPPEEQAPQDEAGPETDVTPVGRDELSEEEKQELDAAVDEPFRTTVAVRDLQPGDIAVRDGEFFVIEEVSAPNVKTADQQNKKVNRATVKGYYPGRKSQERSWFANLNIEVIRGATPPAKGDDPALEKPELADYGRLKKQEDGAWGLREPADQLQYEADYAEFQAQVRAASANFDDPTKKDAGTPRLEEVAADKPADGPFITTDRAEDLQPGDISRKDRFVITRVFKDEATKAGKVSVEGYYPGYGIQRKEWNVNTPIEVVRGIPENEMPEQGEGELHRPAGRGPKGGWFPDPDPAANAEHERKLEEARARWQEPANLPVVAADDAKGANQLEDAPLEQPKAPYLEGFPAFQGFFADVARAAQGKWQAFKDGLKDRDLVVFDFETTGFMPEDGNEPWQIAYRVIRNGEEVRAGGIFMNPGRSVVGTHAGDNAQVDGKPLTDEFLAKQMSQEEGFKWIKDKFGDNPLLIAHNARFDVEILERKFKEFDIEFAPEGIADTMTLAAQFIKDDRLDEQGRVRKKNLKAVAEWLGIELENWHDADADVGATSKIFTGLIERGIELDQGLDALDADARQAEFDEKMARVQPVIDAYERQLAKFWADKAVRDAAAGIEVDLNEVLKNATTKLLPEGPIGNGQPMDNPETPEAPRPDLVDVAADSIFPDGRMRIVAEDWINNLDNVEQIFRGGIKVENLRPGDFVRAKRDSDKFWQVVAIRAGEEYGVENFKRAVFVQNDEGQQRRVFWIQNAFLDEVRRPKNRLDLVPTDNEPTPQQAPERSEDNYTIPVSVPNGKGIVKVQKNDNEFVAEAILQDEDGNVIYNANARNLDKQKAENFARRLVQVFAEALGREQRSQAGEEPDSKSIAVGVAPDNAGEIPRVEQIDNLPFGNGENEITPKVDAEDVVYESNARVIDEDGDVQAQVVENFPTEKAASDGGRENIEGASADIARRIEQRALLMTRGRNRDNLPEIPAKYRRQVFIRLLAGLYADINGNPLAIGDRVIHRNPDKAAEFGEGVVVGKIQGKNGGIQRAGVVYVDYVKIRYPNGNVEKFAAKFQRHVDADVARQRFEAEPRINWMNDEEMKEALEERRKNPRKQPEAEVVEEQVVQKTAAEVVNAVNPELVPDAPEFEFNVDWIKANVEPQDIRVGDIQVGDFMVNFNGDNVGRVVQILDLDAAAQIEVEYPNGRRWTYNPYNKNFLLRGIYRLDDDNDEDGGSGGTPVPDAPQGDAPQGEAPESDAPEVETSEVESPEVEAPVEEAAPAQEEAKTGDPFVDVDDVNAIKEKLLSLAESLPKFRGRGEKNERWARRAIERVAEGLGVDAALYNLRIGYSVLEYSRMIQDAEVKERINSELDKLNENLDKNKDKLKEQAKNELIQKLNTPLDDINVSDSMSQNEILDALRRIKENLPESKDRNLAVQLHWARQEIEQLMERLTTYENRLDKMSDTWYKNPIASIERGDLDPEGQKKLVDKLSQINEVIAKKAEAQYNERNAPLIERFKKPIDYSIFPTKIEDLTEANVVRAIDAVTAILPNSEDRAQNVDVMNNPLFRIQDLLKGYATGVTSRGVEGAREDYLAQSIDKLRQVTDPKALEIADELEKLKNLIAENKENLAEKRRQEYEAKIAEPMDPSVLPEKPKDVTYRDIEGFLAALVDKLPLKEDFGAPEYMREAGDTARVALSNLNLEIETNNLDSLSAEEVNVFLAKSDLISRLNIVVNSIRNTQGLGIPSQAETNLADFVEEAARKIFIRQESLKKEISDNFAAKRAVPLPENINISDENNSKEAFDNLLAELIQRLPTDEVEDRGDISGVLARNALISYKESILQSDDPVAISKNPVDRAIDYLRNASQEEEYGAVINSLEAIKEYISSVILTRPVLPFGGVNLEEVDPIERAEQRVRDRENLFKVAPEIRELFEKEFLTDDIEALVSQDNVGYFREYADALRPFRDELREFFNGQENPMAQLSIRARQALNQTVSRLLKDTNRSDGNYNEPEIKPLTEEQKTALVDLAFALQTERDFYQPQRDDIGEAGRRLVALDPEKFMAAARNRDSSEEVFIDGQPTGFRAKQAEDGINRDFNFFVTDIATGQRFLLKKEESSRKARAEAQSAELIRAFNIGGRYSAEVFPNFPEYLVLTFAGDAIRADGLPENFEDSGLDLYDEAPIRAVMIDTIAMTLVDAVISNTDRHDANFMVLEADLIAVKDNGHENLFVLPVDHGYSGLFNGGDTGDATDVRRFLIGDESWLAREGGTLVRNIGRQLGGFAHKQIIDMSVARAIESLKNMQENGSSVISPNMYSKVISRLEEILDIKLEEWTDYLGGKA
jgi:DNA polymerase III epsilon subunit-like protein